VTGPERLKQAIESIRQELGTRLAELRLAGKMLEAQRLEQRTLYDIEMLSEMGTCRGIENYSAPPQGQGRKARRDAADPAALLPGGLRRVSSTRATSPCRRSRAIVPRRPLAQG